MSMESSEYSTLKISDMTSDPKNKSHELHSQFFSLLLRNHIARGLIAEVSPLRSEVWREIIVLVEGFTYSKYKQEIEIRKQEAIKVRMMGSTAK